MHLLKHVVNVDAVALLPLLLILLLLAITLGLLLLGSLLLLLCLGGHATETHS